MDKTYVYREPYFTIEVVAEGVFCVLVLLACSYLAATNAFGMAGLFAVFGVVALYQVWNTFVARCYARTVTLGDDEIAFESLGRRQSYTLSDLREFRVREQPSSGRMYLRVGDHNALRGRFWIPTRVFSDGRELFDEIRDLEYRVHPDSLKARARRTNEEYVRAFGYGRHRAKAGERRRVLLAVLTGKGETLRRKEKEGRDV